MTLSNKGPIAEALYWTTSFPLPETHQHRRLHVPYLILGSTVRDPAILQHAELVRDLAQVWGQWRAIGMRGRVLHMSGCANAAVTTGADANAAVTARADANLSGHAVNHVIDPEPLILASLVMARYDPLLLDGLLAWLERHGALVNLQRLRTLAREADPVTQAALAAVAAIVGRTGDAQRKWRALEEISAPVEQHPEPIPERLPEGTPYFLTVDGRPRPATYNFHPDFLRHGVLLVSFRRRLRAAAFSASGAPSLLLRLRALCGLSMRCEILCVLGSCGSARPAEVAKQVAQSPRATQKVLVEMARSGWIGQVRVLRRRDYAISSHSPLAPLLRPGGVPTPWIDSISVCRALTAPWVMLPFDERDHRIRN